MQRVDDPQEKEQVGEIIWIELSSLLYQSISLLNSKGYIQLPNEYFHVSGVKHRMLWPIEDIRINLPNMWKKQHCDN